MPSCDSQPFEEGFPETRKKTRAICSHPFKPGDGTQNPRVWVTIRYHFQIMTYDEETPISSQRAILTQDEKPIIIIKCMKTALF
jgi:hypothetical protein